MTDVESPQHFSDDTPHPETMDAQEQWRIATETLQYMLDRSEGIVSSRALRPELERRGVEEARELVIRLKLYDFESSAPEYPTPPFRYHYRGRSFYSEEAYRAAEAETEAAADAAEREAEAEGDYDEEATTARRKYRQEEARLCKYIEEALRGIYASEFGPDVEIAFDVQDARPGAELENVDLLAVHWRSDEVVELVAVEAKLEFSTKLILQATNYKRFAHRVWAALPVTSDEPGIELREYDPLLFEHVIEQGIGVLACRKRQGGAYDIWPIHWPRLNKLDSIARDDFIERYRHVFEEASVVEPREETYRPRLR